jgi:acyl-coenzyme A thioesterase PaaI-like protein
VEEITASADREDTSGPSLQEQYAPRGRCFGCGPANKRGLRIRSHVAGDGTVVATWSARPEHEAWAGIVNGGILGALVDCHSNWTAIAALTARDRMAAAPSTVTAELAIRFRRPTPSAHPIRLVGRVVAIEGDRVTVETKVSSGGHVTVTSRAIFVRVGPGHPAYGRW